jgi:spermidine/putrescine ABC transporter ATP-binding subunit
LSHVELRGVSKRYHDQIVLSATDLVIGEGEFLTLLGPSGCGKTTTLRIIAGFVEPTSGQVTFDGEDITYLPPHRRGIGNVFQDYALFPHLTVAENIAFGLRERRWRRPEISRRVAELLDLIRLPEAGDRLPSQISGGQQQRVAFARAIAFPPRVLLMDEPLGALDLKLRETMQAELRRWQRQLGITTVYVTHDQSEAMNLSDRIAVMEKGRIAQIGSAREIYDEPRSRFVAEFVGQINLAPVTATASDGAFDVATVAGIALRARSTTGVSGPSYLAVRPQNLAIANGHAVPEGHNSVDATVTSQSFSGNLVHIRVETLASSWSIEARPSEYRVDPGARVTLHWHPDHSLILSE